MSLDESLPRVSLYLTETENLASLRVRRRRESKPEPATGRNGRKGKYQYFRAQNSAHRALMSILAGQADDSDWAGLWLAVLDQALVDAFILPVDSPEDRPLRRGIREWFDSRDFETVCELAGLDSVWVREVIGQYEKRRRKTRRHRG